MLKFLTVAVFGLFMATASDARVAEVERQLHTVGSLLDVCELRSDARLDGLWAARAARFRVWSVRPSSCPITFWTSGWLAFAC